MQGGLRGIYETWREGLLDALAQIEGEIDFPDEADIPDALSHKAYPYLTRVIAAMDEGLANADKGEADAASIDRLRSLLEQEVAARFAVGDNAGLTRARHRDCVGRAKESLERAVGNLGYAPELAGDDIRTALRAVGNLGHAPELAGDDIRTALHALKELAGETDIESVFDRIFSRFCVGK